MSRVVLENNKFSKITKNYLLNKNHVINPFGGGVFDLQELDFEDLKELHEKYQKIRKTPLNSELIDEALLKIKNRTKQIAKGINLITK